MSMPFKQSDIELTIETTITSDSTTDQSRLVARGTIYTKGDTTFYTYKEATESGEVTHMIKADDHEITITRHGAVSMRQRFVPSQKTEGTYHTPYGSLPVETLTKETKLTWDNERQIGVLLLTYDLWIQGSHTGFYTVRIHMKGVQP